jgi:Cu2+-exporting ATPase
MTSGSHVHGHDHHQDQHRHDRDAPAPRPERASVESHAHHPTPAGGGEEHGAHDRHAGHSVEMFRDRFWITLALTIPRSCGAT